MRMNCEAVVSHSLPIPVGYGLPALSAAGLNGKRVKIVAVSFSGAVQDHPGCVLRKQPECLFPGERSFHRHG
jgi:hypothetical protein